VSETYALRIVAGRPRHLSEERRTRWARVIEVFRAPFSAASVIFLAELLERLDGGARCSFEGAASVGDMGAEESTLRLSTGRLGLVRDVHEHYDSGELKVVGSYRDDVFGFAPGQGFDWHGLTLDGGTSVTMEGVDRARKEEIVALAQDLFEEIDARWGGDPPPPPPEQRAEELAVRQPLDEGIALMDVSFDDGVVAGESVRAVFRSQLDAEQYCQLMGLRLGAGGGGRCWRAYELRGIRGGKPLSRP
jgi:hypothetical protein